MKTVTVSEIHFQVSSRDIGNQTWFYTYPSSFKTQEGAVNRARKLYEDGAAQVKILRVTEIETVIKTRREKLIKL